MLKVSKLDLRFFHPRMLIMFAKLVYKLMFSSVFEYYFVFLGGKIENKK